MQSLIDTAFQEDSSRQAVWGIAEVVLFRPNDIGLATVIGFLIIHMTFSDVLAQSEYSTPIQVELREAMQASISAYGSGEGVFKTMREGTVSGPNLRVRT